MLLRSPECKVRCTILSAIFWSKSFHAYQVLSVPYLWKTLESEHGSNRFRWFSRQNLYFYREWLPLLKNRKQKKESKVNGLLINKKSGFNSFLGSIGSRCWSCRCQPFPWITQWLLDPLPQGKNWICYVFTIFRRT